MIKLKTKQRCPVCKMLYWRKHTCQRKKKIVRIVIVDNLNNERVATFYKTSKKGCGKYETKGDYTFTCGKSTRDGKIQLCKECKGEKE